MSEPDVMRINLRLYDNRPDDALVMDWLDSLPTSPSGKKVVKQAIVSLLASALREHHRTPARRPKRPAREKASAQPVKVRQQRPKTAEKDVKPQEPVKPTVDELPDFPAIDAIRF